MQHFQTKNPKYKHTIYIISIKQSTITTDICAKVDIESIPSMLPIIDTPYYKHTISIFI
jgi:hypothetical protein